jgi:hypothetical protein
LTKKLAVVQNFPEADDPSSWPEATGGPMGLWLTLAAVLIGVIAGAVFWWAQQH